MSQHSMPWAEALQAMKEGFRVTRECWSTNAGPISLTIRETNPFHKPFVIMESERFGLKPWSPYWHDFEANDWYVVPDADYNLESTELDAEAIDSLLKSVSEDPP